MNRFERSTGGVSLNLPLVITPLKRAKRVRAPWTHLGKRPCALCPSERNGALKPRYIASRLHRMGQISGA